MSMALNNCCSYSNLTTHKIHQAKSFFLIRSQPLNKRKHKQTCIKAMFETDGDEFRTMKRIIRLNSAIQNRSVKEFIDLACDECNFFFNSLPPFNPLDFSKRAFDLIYALMLHHNVTFMVRPTPDEGFDINVKWNLAYNDHSLPLALGCDIHTHHLYKGNLTLSKANRILEYLMHMNKFSQKLEEKIMLLLDRIVPKDKLEGKKREAFMYILVSLVVMLIYYALMQKLVL